MKVAYDEEILEEIARKEKKSLEYIKRNIEGGRIVILKNYESHAIPVAIGKGIRVKINANIGTSPDFCCLEEEIEKCKTAIRYGADTIMDLSIAGDLDDIRREIRKHCNMPLGTVPIYQAFIKACKGDLDNLGDILLKVIEKHCKDGIDFMTIHCGITQDDIEKLGGSKRILKIVSRGGAFAASYMLTTGNENPLFEYFENILEIAKEYGVTLSLGDSFRPGCLNDAIDILQMNELRRLAKLADKANEYDVQVIIEGPGHMRLDKIAEFVEKQKMICKERPLYVLGPLVTDIAVGYDHIAAAIGSAFAALYGADFLCYVTPAEHLALPNVDDVKLGVIAAKIAAHAVNIIRGYDEERDKLISVARSKFDWKMQKKFAIDASKIDEYRKRRPSKTCSMCGDFCAIKILREYLGKNSFKEKETA